MLGLPVAWLALRALAAGDDAAIAIFAVIAIAAVAGFTKAEVERIWLCVRAARLPRRRDARCGDRHLRARCSRCSRSQALAVGAAVEHRLVTLSAAARASPPP